ncbi:hypothetical protein QQG55_53660 [Brugia pahangi]
MFICWEVTNLQVQQADLFSSYIMAFKLSRTVHIRSGYMLSSIFLCLALRDFLQRGPVYSLRLSADPTAHPCSRKWNPQRDTVFAVATSMACFHSFEALYF